MNSKILIPTLLSTLAVAVPATASAATRYASPTGTGPVATCAEADPCSLQDAFEYSRVVNGDEIILASGDYPDSGGVGTDKAVTIHGAAGEPAPVIHEDGDTALYLDDPDLTVADLEVEHTGGGFGLFIKSGTAERLRVHSADATGCFAANATLRDAVCFSESSAGLSSGFANPYDYTLRLRNVTIVSTSPYDGSAALSVDNTQGGHGTVDAKSVIAFAEAPGAFDVYASGGSAGAFSHVELDGSNYDSVLAAGGGTISDPGSSANQVAVPMFTDLAAGELTEAANSPTIDHGISDPLSGSVDLARSPREQGEGIDIGAYEFDPTPPPVDPPPADPIPPKDEPASAPETTITKAPSSATRKRSARFEFSGSGPAAGFECSLDGTAFAFCASPLALRVKRGRHSLLVRAVSAGGKADPTPAEARWKVKRRRR